MRILAGYLHDKRSRNLEEYFFRFFRTQSFFYVKTKVKMLKTKAGLP